MGIPGHLACLLRNLYAGQETTLRTGAWKNRLFANCEEICQGHMLSPCLFNIYAEYIMRSAGLDEAQSRNKIARRSSITTDIQMTPPLWQKVKRTKVLLDKSERGE